MKYRHNPFINRATLVAASLAIGVWTSAGATNFTWGGGTHDWSDTTVTGWNGGPPGGGDSATINSGIVTLTTNNLVNPLSSVTIGGTGKLTQTTDNTWCDFTNLILTGGTLECTRSVLVGDAWGAYQLSNTVTVSGTSASTISTNGTGNIFINLGLAVNNDPTYTTFSVADVTSTTAADLTVSTVLGNNIATNFSSSSVAGLIKTGAGTMTLSANNIYSGGTTVNNGVLEITGSSGGNGYIRGRVTVNSGAELRYTGGDGTGFGFNGGNKIDTLNINGGLVVSQHVAHLYFATVNMTGGELRSGIGESNPEAWPFIHWNNTTLNTLASDSAATISGRINLRGEGYTNAVFNVADGSAATDLLVSAAVTQSGGDVGITKKDAGTMVLTGTNSYLGATQVTEGKLLINGNNSAATGAVTVASGATLGGSGTIGGTLALTGTLSPGSAGTGTLTAGTTTWNGGNGNTNLWEFDLSANSNTSDKLVINGNFTKGTAGSYKFDFMNSAPTTWGNIYTLVTWTGTTNFTLSDFSWTNLGGIYDGQHGTGFTLNANSLTFTAVPEPTSALAGLLLTASLLRRRR